MKRIALSAVLAVTCMMLATPASAHRYERGVSDNPFRVVMYIVHPIGLGLEYAIFRPLHALSHQPDMDVLMGHSATPGYEDTYFEWGHGDYSPSIASVSDSDDEDDDEMEEDEMEDEETEDESAEY